VVPLSAVAGGVLRVYCQEAKRMKITWRWYSEGNDQIKLSDIKQIPGIESIVWALHADIKIGLPGDRTKCCSSVAQ